MANWKVTMMFSAYGQGWSESWFTANKAENTLASDLGVLIPHRTGCLFYDHQWKGIRVSDTAVRRKSRLYLAGVEGQTLGGVKVTIPVNGGFGPGQGADSDTTVNMALKFHVIVSDGRKFPRYFAGLPKDMIVLGDGAFTQNQPAAWWAAWRNYTGQLASRGFGVRARVLGNPATDLPIQALRQQAPPDGVLEILVFGNMPLIFDQKAFLTVQGTRRKASAPGLTLNGKYQVAGATVVTGTQTMTAYALRGTEGIDPSDFKLLGHAQGLTYDQFSMAEAVPLQLISHKRGRPTLVRVGRRSTYASHDP